jgi:hypothetical protein
MMANYSVFYYLARSCAATSEPHLFPEDAFILLRAATENIREFLHVLASRLAKPLGIQADKLPTYDQIEETQAAKDIFKYRNAFVHFARLGRNPNLAWDFIPNSSQVTAAKLSWRYVQKLPEDQFVESRLFLKELQRDLMKAINPVWKDIRLLFDERRESEIYLRFFRLQKNASGELQPVPFGPGKP